MCENWLWTKRRKNLVRFLWRHFVALLVLAILGGGIGGYLSYSDSYNQFFICKADWRYFDTSGGDLGILNTDYSGYHSFSFYNGDIEFLRPALFFVEATFGQELTKRELMELSGSYNKFCSEETLTLENGKLEFENRAVKVGKISQGAFFTIAAPFALVIVILILSISLAALDMAAFTVFRRHRGFRDKTIKWIKDGFDEQARS